MDINNISAALNNYYSNTISNSDFSAKSSTKVPQVTAPEENLKDNSKSIKDEKTSKATELQSLFNKVEPNKGLVTDLKMSNDPKVLAQLNGGGNQIDNKVLDVYNSIQNGTFKPSSTSIVTSDPYSMYTNVNSMMTQLQTTGNLINATA